MGCGDKPGDLRIHIFRYVDKRRARVVQRYGKLCAAGEHQFARRGVVGAVLQFFKVVEEVGQAGCDVGTVDVIKGSFDAGHGDRTAE